MRNFYFGAKFRQKNIAFGSPNYLRGEVVAAGGVGGWAERVEPLVTRLRKKEPDRCGGSAWPCSSPCRKRSAARRKRASAWLSFLGPTSHMGRFVGRILGRGTAFGAFCIRFAAFWEILVRFVGRSPPKKESQSKLCDADGPASQGRARAWPVGHASSLAPESG